MNEISYFFMFSAVKELTPQMNKPRTISVICAYSGFTLNDTGDIFRRILLESVTSHRLRSYRSVLSRKSRQQSSPQEVKHCHSISDVIMQLLLRQCFTCTACAAGVCECGRHATHVNAKQPLWRRGATPPVANI
ncbi:hypothetical protein WUBG_10650 [Wuchereria bancrofti]|uniref:Uncharacterized protein n=1 Tax=Wuchereria bancrofti TaxID=6293 RepID=J9E7Y8_WUCBA|nr:hypothetical protein WUBG_10650 [Wuchereria bancrofti]